MNTIASIYPNSQVACLSCKQACEHTAKFCFNCGFSLGSSFITSTPPGQNTVVAPSFARIPQAHVRPVNVALQTEVRKLMILLARERIFLYMHCLLFLAVNIAGLVMAFKCHSEFLGDNLSKTVMSIIPIMYVNLPGLMFLVPIKGTKREIARHRDRMHYLQLQLEYEHLLNVR